MEAIAVSRTAGKDTTQDTNRRANVDTILDGPEYRHRQFSIGVDDHDSCRNPYQKKAVGFWLSQRLLRSMGSVPEVLEFVGNGPGKTFFQPAQEPLL